MKLTRQEVVKLPKISEKAFQAQVIHAARLLGWKKIYHTHDSRRSAAGFPDLVLVRRGRIIFAELKRDGGKLTPEQREWLLELSVSGTVEVMVWYPRHWPEIEATLA